MKDYLGFTLPLAMHILGCATVLLTIQWWLLILCVASFVLGWIGYDKKMKSEAIEIRFVFI